MDFSNILPGVILWWIVAVDIPLVTLFLISLNRLRREMSDTFGHLQNGIADYKLEVARSYASINQLKDVEGRLIAHLLRIESKLDSTALKAHTLYNNHTTKREDH